MDLLRRLCRSAHLVESDTYSQWSVRAETHRLSFQRCHSSCFCSTQMKLRLCSARVCILWAVCLVRLTDGHRTWSLDSIHLRLAASSSVYPGFDHLCCWNESDVNRRRHTTHTVSTHMHASMHASLLFHLLSEFRKARMYLFSALRTPAHFWKPLIPPPCVMYCCSSQP